MKERWVSIKLGEVCDVIGGGTPSKANAKFYGGSIPWATVRDLREDVITETEHSITPEAVKNSSTNIIPRGNVIIATRVGLGKVSLIEKDMAINQDLRGVIPMAKSNISIGYLFQWFKSISQLIVEAGTGATVQGVRLPFIKNLEIPLPPLAEQQRIVAILDEAFAAIAKAKANAEQNLKNAKELFESYLQGVFEQRGEGWGKFRIEELCESIVDCVNKTAPVTNEETAYKMIRTTNIRFGRVDLSTVRYVTEKTYLEWTRRQKPKVGDILFTREAPMGEVGMLLDEENVFLGQRIVGFRVDESKANKYFILLAFQCNDLKAQIAKLASGATVQHLRVPHTKEFEFWIPSRLEQDTIVIKLDALSAETKRLEAIYLQKIAALDELKKTLLQKAFRGELKTEKVVHSSQIT